MNETDKSTFKSTLVGLSEVYSKEVTPELLKAYWGVLRNLEIEVFINSIQAHLTDTEKGAFFPKPADIIAKAEGTKRDRYLKSIYDIHNTDW